MDQAELNRILQQGEGVRIEFKEAQNGVPDAFYDTVASFLNREGGIILLGVTDDAQLLGLGAQNLMQLKQDIVTALNNPEVIDPPFTLAVNEVEKEGQTMLYVRVPVSSLVHRHAGVIYDRENDSDIRITDAARIALLYDRKRNVFTENQIFPNLRLADLNEDLFRRVRARIAIFNANHPWLTATNERLLRDARFYRRDFITGEEGLTLAAALVFGTDEVIGNLLPAYKIDVLVRRENLDRYDDILRLRTNLIDSYLQVLEFVKSKWPEKFHVEGSDRKDLREAIFRELIANVIIHREYNNATSTEIVIYDDRVVATNPNRARFTGPLDLETFDAEPKNPNIRAFFNVLNWADELGSGIKNMNKYVSIYSGGAHPSFIEDEPFSTIIPMVLVKVADKYVLYLHLSAMAEADLGAENIALLRELPLDLSLKGVTDLDDLALRLVGTWLEKSEELNGLRFLTNKELSVEALKKVGTWEKKSGELLKKRGRVILSTLLLTLQPATLDHLATVLGYNSKERYRDDYLKPMRENRLIQYTKEQANDPNQAYVITQRGKSFIVGSSI
ncbi:MAG: putative DNA binding domain-containing protein [Cryomorphaceae bacterium]